MASPPSSPSLPDAEAPPPPTSPSTVTGGAVSGTIPAAEAFAVHYPGYPSSPARAAQTLGGLPAIAKVRRLGTPLLRACARRGVADCGFALFFFLLPRRSGAPTLAPASSSASAPRIPTATRPSVSPACPPAWCSASPGPRAVPRRRAPRWLRVSGTPTTSKVSALSATCLMKCLVFSFTCRVAVVLCACPVRTVGPSLLHGRSKQACSVDAQKKKSSLFKDHTKIVVYVRMIWGCVQVLVRGLLNTSNQNFLKTSKKTILR